MNEYLCGSDAFNDERFRFHNGRILRLTEVHEITGGEAEAVLLEAMTDGRLPFLMIGSNPMFHEEDVRRFVQDRWEEAREVSRQTRVALRVQQQYQWWQESGAVGGYELRTCPECGTVVIARRAGVQDVDDLEFWHGDLLAECGFCDRTSFFATATTADQESD